MSQSVINWSASRDYALKCSREKRAGKFERVAESFLANEIEAEVESLIRRLVPYDGGQDAVQPADDREFITGAALEKIRERLNERVRQIIQAKVQAHPSCGKTLQSA